MQISLKFMHMGPIHLLHKSNNALDKYPTVHHFVTEMCTFVSQNGTLWGVGVVDLWWICGICTTGEWTVG